MSNRSEMLKPANQDKVWMKGRYSDTEQHGEKKSTVP